jgi:outer membrane murein-binding lipoprotein Lpp
MAQSLRAKPEPGAAPAPGWQPAVVALALSGLALAGCGHAAATDTTSAAGMGVCDNASQVDRLTIDRVNAFPHNHLRFSFPAQVTASSARRAQAVAHALCSLPPMPSGTMSCGADLGVSYRLHVAAGPGRIWLVTVAAGGCEEVSGLGQIRWVARTPAFWGTLGQAAGIAHVSSATFAGTLPS